MQLQYDEKLIETAVLLLSSGRRGRVHPLQVRRFHIEREKLYAIIDAEARNEAFFHLHLNWFREWGLEEMLAQAIGEFPLLERCLATLAFRSGRLRNEEGAELFVNESNRHVILVLRPERFSDAISLATFLRHELRHIDDMLDPEFGYCHELLPHGNPAHQTLARERYRLLWDITIDGRAAALGLAPMASEEKHWADFQRGYSFWDSATQQSVFSSLWAEPSPRHDRLVELAMDPRGLRQSSLPLPGALCSLCGFATFDWSAQVEQHPAIAKAIWREFPDWTADQGVCGRCFDIYRLMAEHPASAYDSD